MRSDRSLAPAGPGSTPQLDVPALRAALERQVEGEVRFDAGHRAIYSHDSSNYRQAPIGVVVPRHAADVEAAIAACHEHGAPVTPRGCATSLAGQACNEAVVIDISKHMRRVVEVDASPRIKMALDHGPEGPPGTRPESAYPDVDPARPGFREGLVAVAAAGLAAGIRRSAVA